MIEDLAEREYIILEIVPTSPNPQRGLIAQISALKLKGLTLIDRFDYRLNDDLIDNVYISNMLRYDCDDFKYVDEPGKMEKAFKEFCSNDLLLIIDNDYTKAYLANLDNEKESIFKYLNTSFYDEVIDDLISKYHLEKSNYIVDLLYESLIYESNNRGE